MSRKQKLLDKAKNNPKGLRFDEFEIAWQGIKESYLKHGEKIPVVSFFKEQSFVV